MASNEQVVAVACLLSLVFRLSTSRRRGLRRRAVLRRLAVMSEDFWRGHTRYCQLNLNVPILRLWFNVEMELKEEFRLSRRAMNSLHRLLKRDQDHGWGYQLEILMYTYWLAHGLSYRVVASIFNIPKATVHRVVHRVANNICRNLGRAISFPNTDAIAEIGQGFATLSGSPVFSCVAGAIDGSHIRIKPPQQHHMDYLNYKGFHSINMMAICDANGRFLDVFVAYPGSVHDTRVMKNSPFYRAQSFPPPGYILVGDGGYPCLETPITLITPYKEPVHERTEKRFNFHHSRARSIIERAFGMMKTRWRSTLFKALEVKHTFAPLVIATCAFLHNVCLDDGDQLEPDSDILEDVLEPQPPREPFLNNEAPGTARRNGMAAMLNN